MNVRIYLDLIYLDLVSPRPAAQHSKKQFSSTPPPSHMVCEGEQPVSADRHCLRERRSTKCMWIKWRTVGFLYTIYVAQFPCRILEKEVDDTRTAAAKVG